VAMEIKKKFEAVLKSSSAGKKLNSGCGCGCGCGC